MNTKVSILEKKIEVLLEQKQRISSERYACQEQFQEALTRVFSKYFRGVVGEDVSITCTNTTISFKMVDEDSREREIFQIYLRENYMRQERSENAYKDAQLSYYTTSTNSDFELRRLENLGRVAMLLRNFKQEVLSQANEFAKIYDAELRAGKFFEKEDEVSEQIRAFRDEISTIKREQKKQALFSEEGLTFKEGTYVQMKFNYTPRIIKLKLIDVSKSGKKATAVFTFTYGELTAAEENVDVAKIIEQVI